MLSGASLAELCGGLERARTPRACGQRVSLLWFVVILGNYERQWMMEQSLLVVLVRAPAGAKKIRRCSLWGDTLAAPGSWGNDLGAVFYFLNGPVLSVPCCSDTICARQPVSEVTSRPCWWRSRHHVSASPSLRTPPAGRGVVEVEAATGQSSEHHRRHRLFLGAVPWHQHRSPAAMRTTPLIQTLQDPVWIGQFGLITGTEQEVISDLAHAIIIPGQSTALLPALPSLVRLFWTPNALGACPCTMTF